MFTQRKCRRSSAQKSAFSFQSTMVLLLSIASLCIIGFTTTTNFAFCHAVEIEATDEWQLVKEGDTVPAGLHIKMDLTTGEKWAKKVAPEGEKSDDEKNYVMVDDEGSVVVASEEETTALSITHPEGEDDPNISSNNTSEEHTPGTNYNYEAMYRTLSKLPEEELIRMGGLPTLPEDPNMSPEEKLAFEKSMEDIWAKRQAELEEMNKNIADLPSIIQDHIDVLMTFRRQTTETGVSEEETVDVEDMLFVLEQLEDILSDIDHARDFHTLGGWPVLVSFLSPSVNLEEDGDSIRIATAWAIGTAVKNHAEFSSWAMEPISSVVVEEEACREENEGDDSCAAKSQSPRTVVSLLLDIFREEDNLTTDDGSSLVIQSSSAALKRKALYAIGSLLRGNPSAQSHFIDVSTLDGPMVLGNALLTTLDSSDFKLASKLLSLANDLIVEAKNQIPEEEGGGEDSLRKDALIKGFTGEQWCQSPSKLLQLRMDSDGGNNVSSQVSRHLETTLGVMQTMMPYCQHSLLSKIGSHKVVSDLKFLWEQQAENRNDLEDEAFLDPEWRIELVQLAESVMKAMEKH